MNAEISRLRSTGTTESDISAIWSDVLLIVYLAATAIVLLVGRDHVTVGGIVLHLLVLVAFVATALLPLVPPWLRRWAPLIALLFLYAEIPMLLRAAGHDRVYDATVIRWEQAIFSAQPALRWAARVPSRFLSETLHAAYLSYYGIIFAVPLILFATGRRQDYDAAVFVLMTTFVVCFVAYLFFPVAGPRYLWRGGRTESGFFRAIALSVLESRSSRGTAFPSSHVAVAVTQTILAWKYLGRVGAAIGVLAIGLAFGAVYGGFHYAVDVIAGALLGVGTTITGLGVVRVLATRTR